MATNVESQVAAVANQIISLTYGLYSIQQQINQVSALWTNLSIANKLNNFPTAAATATGGQGTADQTPVVTDPINTSVAPGTLLNVAISANNIASLLTYLQGISNAIGGSAVGANGAAVQLVALTLI